MAKTKISEFSATPANNTDIDSINIAEGCAPSGINDAIRELMAQLKDFQTGAVGDSFNGPVGTSTAAAGAFTTLAASGAVTLSGGTANGVTYLNGSKVLTSGSALTFDGSRLFLGTTAVTTSSSQSGEVYSSGAAGFMFTNTTAANYALSVKNEGTSGTRNLINFYEGTGGGSARANISLDGSANFAITSSTSLVFSPSSAEGMRLTSTGLGIGTSSPATKLHVEVSGASSIITNKGTSANYYGYAGSTLVTQLLSSSTQTLLNSVANVPIIFSTNDTERMRLDSAGNLGLGVTPSAWGINRTAIQLGGSSGSNFVGGATTALKANNYFGSTDTYIANGFANAYVMNGGSHLWLNAPSGTAGNTISFTQAMTLGSDGNLLVGTTSVIDAGAQGVQIKTTTSSKWVLVTSSPDRAWIANTTQASGTSYYAYFNYNTSNVGAISSTGTVTVYSTTSDYRLKTVHGALTGYGERIDALKPISYEWKNGALQDRGFLAHEFQIVYPNSVTGEKDAVDKDGKPVYQAMQAATSEVIADLVAEIQSLRARVAQLETN